MRNADFFQVFLQFLLLFHIFKVLAMTSNAKLQTFYYFQSAGGMQAAAEHGSACLSTVASA